MRKHIGARMIVLIIALIGVFLINSILSGYSSEFAMSGLNTVNNQYLPLEELNADQGIAIGEARLYSNLLALTDNEQTFKGIAASAAPPLLEKLNANVAALTENANATGKQELITATEEYNAATQNLINNLTAMVEAALAGDRATAVSLNANTTPYVNVILEKSEIFSTTLHDCATNLAAEKAKQAADYKAICDVLFFVYLGVAAVMYILIRQTIIKPAKQGSKHLAQIIEKIDQNQGDLTERIACKSKDELGQLIAGINNFIGKLQDIMQKIQTESVHLDQLVDNITVGIVDSNENAGNISATMEEMSASMEEISATVSQIADSTSDVVTQMKDMSAQADEGANYCGEIKDRARSIQTDVVTSKDTTNQMLAEIRVLLENAIANSKSVEKINELTNEILNISSQTNLLALNASIEAARAGEAGRGFAVVADEIRVLADNSKDTANNIQTVSGMVTNAVEQLAKHANEMLTFIDTTVLSDYDKFVDVAEKYHEDADSLNKVMNHFYQSAHVLEDTMNNMADGVNGINIAVDESAQGVTLVAQNTGQLVEALVGIRGEADTNKEISELLQNEVQRFTNI